MSSKALNFHRGYQQSFLGQIHYREYGDGPVVLCLHQSPQSGAMFDCVFPFLGKHFRAIAMDTIGYGMSDNPGRMVEPEEYGRTILEFLDGLGIRHPIPIIGVHTGAYFATQTAVQAPERVSKLILSGPVLLHPNNREIPLKAPITIARADGGHLMELWKHRWKNVEPVKNVEAFQQLYISALKAGPRAQDAYYANAKLDTLKQIQNDVKCPVYIVWGDRELSAPGIVRCLPLIPQIPNYVIKDGTLDMMEEFPEEWADAVINYIKA